MKLLTISAAIFLLALAPVSNSDPTSVHVLGALGCFDPLLDVWCYRVKLLEVDSVPISDDTITYVGVKCTSYSRILYQLKGMIYGDGIYNNEYEFAYRVRHNCSYDNRIRDHVIYVKETYPVNQTEIILNMDEDIWSKGDIEEDWGW